MTTSLLTDAFSHHTWATLRLLDACRDLDADRLATTAPGTFGSIIDTLRHLVGADTAYLHALTGGAVPGVDTDTMGIAGLRSVMEANGEAWTALVAEDLDPTAIVIRYRDDGSAGHAPAGIRLAQALHHGTDHRSQVCTVLTTMGIEPPPIDVWDFAEDEGRLFETPAPS
jgi:uncharacterized damage-inducible protein DinB